MFRLNESKGSIDIHKAPYRPAAQTILWAAGRTDFLRRDDSDGEKTWTK